MDKYGVIIALLSLSLSIVIAARTLPKEQPIIGLSDTKTSGAFHKNTNRISIDLLLLFQNIGMHPAADINIKIATGIMGHPESFKYITNQTIANEIGVGNIFNWNQHMELLPTERTKDGQFIFKEIDTITLIRLTYRDKLWFNKWSKYKSDFWLTYRTGRAAPAHATIEEKEANKEYLLKYID